MIDIEQSVCAHFSVSLVALQHPAEIDRSPERSRSLFSQQTSELSVLRKSHDHWLLILLLTRTHTFHRIERDRSSLDVIKGFINELKAFCSALETPNGTGQ